MKRALAFTLMVLAIMIIAVSCDEPHVHSFSNDWESNENYHWHKAICEHTDEVGDKAEHVWKEGGDKDGWITEKAATETEKGSAYRICTVCGYKGTKVIQELSHVHTYSSYGKDDNKHWRTCTSCGEKFSYTHTFSYVDAGTSGHYKKCNCGYSKLENHVYTDKKVLKSEVIYKVCDICGNSDNQATSATDSSTVVAGEEADLSGKSSKNDYITVKENGKNVTKKVKVITTPVDITVKASAETGTSTGKTTTVSFPSEALKIDKDATSVSLVVEAADISAASAKDSGYQITTSSSSSGTGAVVAGFEFNLSNAVASDLTGKDSDGNVAGVTVKTYIASNLTSENIESYSASNTLKIVYVDGDDETAKITKYEKNTGYLEFTVYHFSRYAIVADGIVARDSEGNMYASLEGDDGAVTKVNSDKTVTLLKNTALTAGINIPTKKTITIDLNGKTISTEKTANYTVLTNCGTLTLKNGTLDLSAASGNGYTFIANKGTLSTDKVEINMEYKATGTDTNSSVYGIFSGNGSGESTLKLLNETKISLDVVSESSPIKPTAVYCIQNTESTIKGSEITTTSSVNGSVYGFYVLVYDQDSNETGATGTLTGTTISVSTSGIGRVTPVFAESWDDNKEASITLTNCTVESKSNCANNSDKTVYGVRAKGLAVVTLDASTESHIELSLGSSKSQKTKFAAEVQDHTYTDENLYGTIITPSYRTVSKDQEELEKAISEIGENGTIVLIKNLKLTKALTIDSGKAFTLDLCDKERTINTKYSIANSGNLTIKNGKIESEMTPTSGAVAFRNEHGAVLTTSGLTLDITFTTGTDATGDLVGLYNVGTAVIENSKISVSADKGKSKVLGVYSNDGDAAGTTVRKSKIEVKSDSEGSSYGFYMLLRSYPESNVTVGNSVVSRLDKTTVTVTQTAVGSVSPVFAESYEEKYTSTINIENDCTIEGNNATVENNKSGETQKYVYAVRAKGNAIINIDKTSADKAKCVVHTSNTSGKAETLAKEKLTINKTEVTGTITTK